MGTEALSSGRQYTHTDGGMIPGPSGLVHKKEEGDKEESQPNDPTPPLPKYTISSDSMLESTWSQREEGPNDGPLVPDIFLS